MVIGRLKVTITKNDPILDRISLYGHRSTHCDPYLDRLEVIQFWIVSPQFAQLISYIEIDQKNMDFDVREVKKTCGCRRV